MNNRNSRQGFLGKNFLDNLNSLRVVIIGLGGGGSFIAKELAHVGFKNFILIDDDIVEFHNLIRLIGATLNDVERKSLKVEVAKRGILELENSADVKCFPKLWQECIDDEFFKNADVVFSCIDDFYTRLQLENFTRKLNIPLIDIGMSVTSTQEETFMFGQVVLSHPKGLSFRCYNFCNEDDLSRDDKGYGNVGIRPQVIWPNSILAGIAVGVAVELFSNWTKKDNFVNFYKHLDGNNFKVFDHILLEKAERIEAHSCDYCSQRP